MTALYTPHASDRYLANWPVFLTAISTVLLGLYYLIRYLRSSQHPTSLSPSQLISPSADSDLAKLEANVIISSIATSLLPPSLRKSEPEKSLPVQDALKVIEDFKVESLSSKRWQTIRYWIRIGGGAVWFLLEGARAVESKRWQPVVYPVSCAADCIFPSPDTM